MKKILSCLLVAPLATAALALAQANPAPEPAPTPQKATAETPAPSPGAKPMSAGRPGAIQAAQRMPVDRIIDGVLEPLEMTPEQSARIGEIRTAWVERTEALRADVRAKTLAYRTLTRSQSTSPADAEAKRTDLAAAHAALQEEVQKLDEEIAAALDPDRREKYLAARDAMKARVGRPSGHPSAGTNPAPPSGR